MRESETRKSAADTSAAVADYLRRHPDFLERHPDLIETLLPPAAKLGDGVVDMQRFMLARLQADTVKLKAEQAEMIAAARANLSTQSRVHTAVLAMLGATTLEHLIEIVATDFAIHLEVDAVALGFEAMDRVPPGGITSAIKVLPKGRIDRLMQGQREILLIADTPGEPELFGGAAHLVRAQALVRLDAKRDAPLGILAFGARAPDKFHPGQGTELIKFLARALELSLRAWLDR